MNSETKMIRKVIPVKGNLRKKFLKELKDSQSSPVTKPLKSPENKIIIQKVENVKLEIITNSSKPISISSLFTSDNLELSDQNSVQCQTNESTFVLKSEDLPEIERESENAANNNSTQSIQLKLMSAKIPENNFNAKIPLKMVRTLKAPKSKPNLLHRIHRVETNKIEHYMNVMPPVDLDGEVPTQSLVETHYIEAVPNKAQNDQLFMFNGFDEVHVQKLYNIGLWSEILSSDLKDDSIEMKEDTAYRTSVEVSHQNFTTAMPKSCQQEIYLNESPITHKSLFTTSPKQFPSSEKLSTLPPKKDEICSTEKPSLIKKTSEKFHKTSQLITSTPVPSNCLPSTSKSLPTTSKNVRFSEMQPEVKKEELEDWMEDILTVIGTSRIAKIDESLKDIPNLITGNFSIIETENVEFKLIIKHLLRELGVSSILDTVKFPSPNMSAMSMFKDDNDDEDDFSESYGDDSNEASSYIDDLSNDQTMDEETCRNSDPPHLSLSLANSFIPSIKSPSSSSFFEKSTLSPEIEVQISNQNKSQIFAMDGLKRERESDDFDSYESSPKKAKNCNGLQLIFTPEAEVPQSSSLSLESDPEPTKDIFEKINSPKHLLEILNATTSVKQENECSSAVNLIETLILPVQPSKNSEIEQEPLNILSENESDDDVGILRPSLKKPLKPLSDDSDNDMDKNPEPESCSDDSNAPLIRNSSKRIAKISRLNRKNVVADDSSSMSSEVSNESRAKELNSRLSKLDSNSNEKTPLRNEKLAVGKTANAINENTPVDDVNGFSDNEDSRLSETSTEISSVTSRTSIVKNKSKDLNKKRSKKAGKPPEKAVTPKNQRRSRKSSQTSEISKKIFVKELVESAIESKVPYDEILQGIKSCVVGKRLGRVSAQSSKEDEVRKQEYFKKLKALQFFRCGSCEFDVTKHKWTEHFLSHGGLAWVDGFETPILLADWNEALRRMIHGFKIYKQAAMRCPNCGEEKRSALGHLSHIFVCGESEEALEGKKLTCVHCSERFLPFYASSHKTKCTGMVTVVPPSNNDDDGRESEKEENSSESFNVSGRQKRKAVKKAEKNFKKILNNSDDVSDHLQIVSGQIKCQSCGRDNFTSQKEAIEHIKRQHNNVDFEASDSDASVVVDDSSEESEGSSGVESSEMEASDDDDCDNEGKTKSSRRHRLPTTEPQEIKNGRLLISEYVDAIRTKDISSKTVQWTRKIYEARFKFELLQQQIPRLLSSSRKELKMLSSLNLKFKSPLFGVQQREKYSSKVEVEFDKEWKRLEIGECDASKYSATVYCGGSVAAIDWAPSNSNQNFLAVACNVETKGIKMNLETTTRSCVQIHEIKDLENENFKEFAKDSTRLCYAFVIESGPIWSIKFHPNESALEKRLGILAVATSNQSVLIYSLPFLNDNNPTVLSISPNFVCNLKEGDVFFNQKYLEQVTRLSWFVTNDKETLLAAGYVSGLVSVWHVSEDEDKSCLYPRQVIQAHNQSITALDFKATESSAYHLLTAGFDRNVKVFTFEGVYYQEMTNHYALSRANWAEWWLHWPGFIMGLDDCFALGSLVHRQPLEFAARNNSLLSINSTIVNFNINHWLNSVIFVLDSGDVLGCHPGQLLQALPKDKWTYFKFSIFSSTDFNKVVLDGKEEIGIVFSDFKNATQQPKSYRQAPTDRINELLINQVCFNRNEKSCRFYALGYETGFVRIRYLKNSK